MSKKHLIYLALIFAAITIIARIIPHPWNFTPMGALVLFSGFVLSKRWLWLPIVALAATDAILGTYHWQVMFAVYGSYAVMLVASYAARKHYSFGAILGSSIGAAVLFFLTTNAAVALWSGMYAQSFDGVMASYIAAIPFFRGTLLGHLAYGAVFFGAYELVRMRKTVVIAREGTPDRGNPNVAL